MPLSEQIGGTQLSDYGLRLARLEGNMDLPPYKTILNEHDFESNLLVLNEETVKIKLIGIYSSKSELGTLLSQFYAKIRSGLKLTWIFSNHAFEEDCVVKDGITCNIYGTVAELMLTLRIVPL